MNYKMEFKQFIESRKDLCINIMIKLGIIYLVLMKIWHLRHWPEILYNRGSAPEPSSTFILNALIYTVINVRGVDQYTDTSVCVFDMNSIEASMQSLYPPAWNCLPHLSADKVTGKMMMFGGKRHSPCNLSILHCSPCWFLYVLVADWCFSLQLFTQTNIMLQFLYGCTKNGDLS